MPKLTNDEVRYIYEYIKLYIPSYSDQWNNTPLGLSVDAHRKAHSILIDIRREGRRIPLDTHYIRSRFGELYEVIGEWLSRKVERERRLFLRFKHSRTKRTVLEFKRTKPAGEQEVLRETRRFYPGD